MPPTDPATWPPSGLDAPAPKLRRAEDRVAQQALIDRDLADLRAASDAAVLLEEVYNSMGT